MSGNIGGGDKMVESNDLLDNARQFWNSEIASPTHTSWLASEKVRVYANELISGPERLWPIDWFHAHVAKRVYARGLSIGCGTGALERDLIARGLVLEMDAFDGSDASIREAIHLAETAGVAINYFVQDFNAVTLPKNRYDIVLFHQSLHHVARLERLLRQVHRSLREDGILYLDEYIGPSRHEWSDQRIALHRALFARIPSEWRTAATLALPIQADDPSEAIRSGEILDLVRKGFDIVEERPYGGNILSVLYPVINWDAAPEDLLDALIEFERDLVKAGVASYYGVVVATPKAGTRGVLANVDYFLRPKLLRIPRSLGGFLRRIRTA